MEIPLIELIVAAVSTLAPVLVALWVLSIVIGKVSFVDSLWGFGFVILSGAAAYTLPSIGPQQSLALLLVGLWGVRLFAYLLERFFAHGEDRRYVKLIGARTGAARHFFTAWCIFALQGSLMVIICMPVFALLAAPAAPLTMVSYAAAFLWLIGAVFEWGGDWQLSRFKSDPANEGKILDTGLWAWTRHPNYFGDTCMWWGIWAIGHDPYMIFAPALITLLLMKGSGVPILEKSLHERRPAYADYCARTSRFFPLPPTKK